MSGLPDIYLLRHGQTTWNAAGRIQGQRNSDLSALGKTHAAQQGQLLAPVLEANPGIDIYCSPLRRTRQTAAIAMPDHIHRFRLDDRLKEVCVGAWEGHLRSHVAARFPDAFDSHARLFQTYMSAPGGERTEDLIDRATSFLNDLNGPAIVVAHGILNAFLRAIYCGLGQDDTSALGAEQGVVLHLRAGRETTLRLT